LPLASRLSSGSALAAIFGLGPFGGDKGVVVPPDDLDDFNMPVVATPDVNTPEVNEIVVVVPEDVTKDEPNVAAVKVDPNANLNPFSDAADLIAEAMRAVKVDPNANLNPFSDAADLIAEAMRLLNSRPDRIIEADNRGSRQVERDTCSADEPETTLVC